MYSSERLTVTFRCVMQLQPCVLVSSLHCDFDYDGLFSCGARLLYDEGDWNSGRPYKNHVIHITSGMRAGGDNTPELDFHFVNPSYLWPVTSRFGVEETLNTDSPTASNHAIYDSGGRSTSSRTASESTEARTHRQKSCSQYRSSRNQRNRYPKDAHQNKSVRTK